MRRGILILATVAVLSVLTTNATQAFSNPPQFNPIYKAMVLRGYPNLGLSVGEEVLVSHQVTVTTGFFWSKRTSSYLWTKFAGPSGTQVAFLPLNQDVMLMPGQIPPTREASGTAEMQAWNAALKNRTQPMVATGATGYSPEALATQQAALAAAAGPQPMMAMAAAAPAVATPQAVAQSGACSIQIPWMPETVTRWENLICDPSVNQGLDPKIIAIICLIESGGNPNAGSNMGAQGLMQLMPATAAAMGISAAELKDPKTSLTGGAKYFISQMREFNMNDGPSWRGTIINAAGAYNGGPGVTRCFLKGQHYDYNTGKCAAGQWLPDETTRYREWATMWDCRDAATCSVFDAWMAAGGAGLVQKARAEMAAGG